MELPVISVKELNQHIKLLIESSFPEVYVRGEVSNVRSQASGHTYFSLKDEDSQIKAALFRNAAPGNVHLVQHGKQIVVRGRLSVYEPRGEYSIVVNEVEEDGVGALQRRFEALKKQLHSEGLFDSERKRVIPAFPKRIAVVTSPSGAALRDFLGILRRRSWRGDVVVFPCRVQGQEAVEEIAQKVEQASEREDIDLTIVTRGGGSLEDLWAFNEERVVRALAVSETPSISAVGHEIDTVLTDFAADRRAETPSGAAELITSAFNDLNERFEYLSERFLERTVDRLRVRRQALDLFEQKLERQSPRNRIEREWMRLDDLENRIQSGSRMRVNELGRHLDQWFIRFNRHDPNLRIKHLQERVASLGQRLETCSAHQTLKRGFALVRDQQGNIVPSRRDVRRKKRLELQFHDGELPVQPLNDDDQLYMDL
ncbi:MAG: exodeoxyribonuclease VII large subunit [Opitutales bacterium]|nr:exodeoxyribonuclease VII large subunit [Opitutales bacterium]NRA26862.1 exodeoxyribonuclease VII large subunit [Opitutales bacterium]